ncbi:MAG: hypothetical protein ACYDC5_02735 [Candidatus Dormibacteria bacterium]
MNRDRSGQARTRAGRQASPARIIASRGLRFCALATAVVSLAVALSACGGPVGSAHPLDSSPATLLPALELCDPGVAATHLAVRRTDEFPQNHISFNFPDDITVVSSSQTRMVADAICALPRMPSGAIRCPLDLGIVYHLSFSTGTVEFSGVSVGATGCQVVRGLGADRWVARSPDFWRTLGVAMGLTSPDLATFVGPLP